MRLCDILFLGLATGLVPLAAEATPARPVVVELFTSEGCSSCPPADTLLTALVKQQPDVLALAFHVDYWDWLGWRDPFSQAFATGRQAAYSNSLGGRPYTPEIVVDGAAGMVGSDRGAVERAIRAARRDGTTAASVSLARSDRQLAIQVGAGVGEGKILLVGFDHRHVTAIGRGENDGKVLTESNIVRSLTPLGAWSGQALTLSAAMPDGEDAAVLLQAADGRIVGVASLDPQS
jgi:hypothetical protein